MKSYDLLRNHINIVLFIYFTIYNYRNKKIYNLNVKITELIHFCFIRLMLNLSERKQFLINSKGVIVSYVIVQYYIILKVFNMDKLM